jgi:hypothetical protein
LPRLHTGTRHPSTVHRNGAAGVGESPYSLRGDAGHVDISSRREWIPSFA